MEMNLKTAQIMVAKAVEKATVEFKRPICVSVCDKAGFLIAFNRVEGGHMRSIDISQAKAYTAARMGVNTDAFLARLQREQLAINYFCDTKMTALPGGAVIKDAAGNVLGGVGVAGLKAEEDQAVAQELAELVKGF